MICISQQNPNTEIFPEIASGESFHSGLSTHGHEHGGFDGAVSCVQQPGAGARDGAFGYGLEPDLAHDNSV